MAAEPTGKSARAEKSRTSHRQPTPPRLVLRRAGLALGRAQPVFGAMLDPRLQFRLFNDPPQIFGIVAGNLGVTFAAVLAKVKAGVKRRLGRPAHQFAPARSLDQFFEDRSGDDHVESGTVRLDPTAFRIRKRGRASERIAQLLIAVAFEVRPHPQRALVGADPGPELDALRQEETALEFAIVGDIDVCPAEPVGDLRQQRRVPNILIDDVMNGGGTGRNRFCWPHQRVHGVGDTTASHHIDAGDFNDRIGVRIGPGRLYVDDAYHLAVFLTSVRHPKPRRRQASIRPRRCPPFWRARPGSFDRRAFGRWYPSRTYSDP